MIGGYKDSISDDDWLKKVHAAKLLDELFTHFSEKRVRFSKTRDSSQLTDWIIENEPNLLSELATFLKDKIQQ